MCVRLWHFLVLLVCWSLQNILHRLWRLHTNMPCQRTISGNCLTVFWHSNLLGYLWMSRESLPGLVLFKLDLQTTFRLVGFPANTSPGLIMECAAFVGWQPKVWWTTKHWCGTWSYSQVFLLLYIISQVEVSVWFIFVQVVTVAWLLADASFSFWLLQHMWS